MTGKLMLAMTGALCAALPAGADVFHTYEDLAEGFYGPSYSYDGVTYHDVNNVSGFTPDGEAFDEDDLGNEVIIENAALFYNDFPTYGSPINAMTFGSVFVPGENLSIGALASVWMTPDVNGTAASLDIAFYENGPWGGIQWILEAVLDGQVVATDTYDFSDLGGRDNATFTTLSIEGVEFDSLHLYSWLDGEYTAARGMIDDVSITSVPVPGAAAVLAVGLGGVGLRRRRRA